MPRLGARAPVILVRATHTDPDASATSLVPALALVGRPAGQLLSAWLGWALSLVADDCVGAAGDPVRSLPLSSVRCTLPRTPPERKPRATQAPMQAPRGSGPPSPRSARPGAKFGQ